MMMNKYTVVLTTLLLAALLTSCASRVNGALLADGQADLQVYAALEPRMTMLIGGLMAASGTAQPGAPILNGPSISASMASAPGVASVALVNRTPAAVEGPVKIAQVGDFLSGTRAGSHNPGFIRFEQGTDGGRCTINLSLETGPEILRLLSPEISNYLNALMAPITTGEKLTKTGYIALVGSVYGRGIADEIAHAVIQAFIDFPGQIQSAKGGTFSGRRAEFTSPLADLLVLETPLSYEVVWR
jgi:hypothetical protein